MTPPAASDPAPLLLALDTATPCSTVALCRGEAVLAEEEARVTTHSEGLLPMIHAVLQRAGVGVEALDGVVCGRGPGSFTGLRIGLATAKGLCLAGNLPLYGVSSLLPPAAETEAARPGSAVAVVLDARRKEVFCGLFRGGEALAEELLCRPEGLGALLDEALPDEPLLLAGDGALLYQQRLLADLGPRASLAPDGCHAIYARHLARAALPRHAAGEADNLMTAVPRYLRASDARLPKIPQDRRPA